MMGLWETAEVCKHVTRLEFLKIPQLQGRPLNSFGEADGSEHALAGISWCVGVTWEGTLKLREKKSKKNEDRNIG